MGVKKVEQKPRIRKGGRLFEFKIFDWMRYGLTWLVALFLKLWWVTLRIEYSEEELALSKKTVEEPSAVISWHNNLFLLAYWASVSSKRKLYALISAGSIGAWISPFFEHFKVKSIRGSINLRGKQALKEVIQTVEAGNNVIVTPDGSRGPVYRFKPGVALLLRKTDCHLVLVSFKYDNAWRLKSWDKFYIPKPFSKVTCNFTCYSSYKKIIDSDNVEDIAKVLEDKLMELNK